MSLPVSAGRILRGAVAAALITLVPAASAAAKSQPPDLHDARYCEILELRGEIPNAQVLVWNTIGLNDCPAAQWDAIDATALAVERGDKLVLKNGPRHFLMDTATAEIGRKHTFGGVAMRKVATIPITTPADLVQATYTERTIERHNTWTWEKGRRVFELLAPDGSNYVMQSYSQIKDPEQTLADLRTLGSRLSLPQGWTYRSRRLKRDLNLVADGSATIVQDDLTNTYQKLPRTKRRHTHKVAVAAVTKSVGSPAPGVIEDQGTVSGDPFGDGTVDILVTFGADSTATGSFTIETPSGSAFGTIAMTYVISGSEITFTGTATFSGGTGEFRGIKGTVDAYDHNTLDGQSGTVRLNGSARY